MEVVGNAIDDDGVASIVATGGSRGDLELARQEVNELSLAWQLCQRDVFCSMAS